MGGKVTLHDTITDGITVSDEKHPSHQYSERARRHLWLQMSRLGAYDEHNEIPIMVRGSMTRTAPCISTAWPDSSPTHSDTAAATSARPPRRRSASSASSRPGPTRTPRPSNWPSDWRV